MSHQRHRLVGSLPSFLQERELQQIRSWLGSDDGEELLARSTAAERNTSVHREPGVAVDQLRSVYEPLGRIEIAMAYIPGQIITLLDSALERRSADIEAVFGVAPSGSEWVIVRYSEGQYITPHADGLSDDPGRRSLASLSMSVEANATGGEFIADMTISRDGTVGAGRLEEPADQRAAWVQRRTQRWWVPEVSEGDAIVVGPWVMHGTRPVTLGTVTKVLGFIYSGLAASKDDKAVD